MLKHNVNIWFNGGAFDHSKVTVVDRSWVIFGSPNWDPRSLRLNFEFSLECYDREFAAELSEDITARVASSRQWTLKDHHDRSLLTRLRDGVFRLGAPYL
jgi:cardiolipin synthase